MAVHSSPLVLLTRPLATSRGFARRLDGVDTVLCPLMEIVGTDAPMSLDGVAGIIFTSAHAVPFVPALTLPAYCVGSRTTQAATAAGFSARCMGRDADGLVSQMLNTRPDAPLLHAHGVHTRGDVAARLTKAGLPTQGIAIYDQRPVAPSPAFRDACQKPNLIVPVFSPRSGKLLAEATPELPMDARLVAISTDAAAALPAAWQARTVIAPNPSGDDMRDVIMELAQGGKMQRNSP